MAGVNAASEDLGNQGYMDEGTPDILAGFIRSKLLLTVFGFLKNTSESQQTRRFRQSVRSS